MTWTRRQRWIAAAALAVLTALFGVLFLNASPCADPACESPSRLRALWSGLTLAFGAACAIVLPLRRA